MCASYSKIKTNIANDLVCDTADDEFYGGKYYKKGIIFGGKYYPKVIHRDRYDITYALNPNRDVLYMEKYIMHDGHKLFRIKATYAKQLSPTNYYAVGKDKRQAKEIFSQILTWLKFIDTVERCTEEETVYILNNPSKFIIM